MMLTKYDYILVGIDVQVRCELDTLGHERKSDSPIPLDDADVVSYQIKHQ